MSEKELVVEDIDRGKSLLPVTRSPWNLLWKVLCHIFIVNVTKTISILLWYNMFQYLAVFLAGCWLQEMHFFFISEQWRWRTATLNILVSEEASYEIVIQINGEKVMSEMYTQCFSHCFRSMPASLLVFFKKIHHNGRIRSHVSFFALNKKSTTIRHQNTHDIVRCSLC